jgi:transglutaminase-like putative cysteine protease
MYYSIRHLTRFRYSAPIRESIMEVRMHPRNEQTQRCLEFRLQTEPSAQIMYYRDYLGNTIHHFGVPGRHTQLTITAESLVEMLPPPPLPEALDMAVWEELDNLKTTAHHWDMLVPSHFAHPSDLLYKLQHELAIERNQEDPLTTLLRLNTAIYNSFEYVPMSTTVDSPIDDSLRERRGVCQDFAHVMITIVRLLGIPCRYVSGYLFHRAEDHDRSEEDATHAWLEAYLPTLGWIGFDPTNNLVCAERHLRTAIGRDYADVPPTRGVFKGNAESELEVGVRVSPTEAPIAEDVELLPVVDWLPPTSISAQDESDYQEQQRDQQ